MISARNPRASGSGRSFRHRRDIKFTTDYDFRFGAGTDSGSIPADEKAECYNGSGFRRHLEHTSTVEFRYADQDTLESVDFKCMTGKYRDEPDCGRRLTGFVVRVQPDGHLNAAILSGSCNGMKKDDGVVLQKQK
jgi:hypothetical protein